MGINKQEIRYIIWTLIFIIIWFFAIIPLLRNYGIEDSSVQMQFLVFNVGVFIFLQIFLKMSILKSGLRLKETTGLIFLVIALDLILPPFLVTMQGELLNDVILKAGGSDYFFAYFAINNLGLSGVMVFIFTYILMPTLLLFLSAYLLPNFIREI